MGRPITVKMIRGEWLARLKAAQSKSSLVAERVVATGDTEEFFYAGQVPAMSSWNASRSPMDMFQAKRSKTPNLYETSIKWDRFEKKDAQLPQFFANRIADLARAVTYLEDDRVLGDLIDASESATGAEGDAYDGQAFHDTDHLDPTSGQSTYDNDRTSAAATGTDPTLAEFAAAVEDGLEQFASYVDDRGRPWHAEAGNIVLVIPRLMQHVAIQFVQSRSIHSDNPAIVNASVGITNFQILLNRYTANQDRFTMEMPGDEGRMPYGIITWGTPVFNQVTGDRSGEVDFNAFMNRYDFAGVHVRQNVIYGQPRSSIKHTFT